jgi:hypothetical protein
MKRSRLPCLPFSIQLTLDHSKCTSSNVTEHRNIPGVTPGLRTLSAWGYGRSSYRLPHLYTPLPLTKRDATMAVPQADKPRGPTYELTQPRVARFRSRVHVLSGYGLVTVEKHTIDTSTRRRTPPFLGSLTRTPPPPPFQTLRATLLLLCFFFLDMSYQTVCAPSRAPSSSLSPARPSTHNVSYRHQNTPYAGIPFNSSDGYLVRMFGTRDAPFFLESLLKVDPQDVSLISNVPGWPNALMVSRPSVSGTHHDALANNQYPLWLLDFVPAPRLIVVTQQIWSPPNQSDWRRYVEQAHLRMPVFFVQNNGAIGLPLSRAAVGDTASLRNADKPAPLGGGHSTQIRISARIPLFPFSVTLSLRGFPPSSGLAMRPGNGRFR